jgi:hypothetical protein
MKELLKRRADGLAQDILSPEKRYGRSSYRVRDEEEQKEEKENAEEKISAHLFVPSDIDDED